jgi:hypothetical protein
MGATLDVDVLDFVVTDECADVDAGRYSIASLDKGEWAALFTPINSGDTEIEINAFALIDGEEELIDWPSYASAKEICGAHARLMRNGQSAENAAKLILEFSREYLRERAARDAAVTEREAGGHATH